MSCRFVQTAERRRHDQGIYADAGAEARSARSASMWFGQAKDNNDVAKFDLGYTAPRQRRRRSGVDQFRQVRPTADHHRPVRPSRCAAAGIVYSASRRLFLRAAGRQAGWRPSSTPGYQQAPLGAGPSVVRSPNPTWYRRLDPGRSALSCRR